MPQISTAQPHQAINPMDKVSCGVYKLLGNVILIDRYICDFVYILEDSGIAKTTLVPTFPEIVSSCKQLVNRVENLTGSSQVLQIDKLLQITEL